MRNFVLFVCLVFIVVCTTVALSACSPQENGEEMEASSELDDPPDEGDTGAQTPPGPTASPVVVAYVDPVDYDYHKEISSSLDIGMFYPSHWSKETGKHTIVYKQPVNDGELAARISITTRKTDKSPTSEKMAELIEEFTTVIAKQYADFVPSEIRTDIEFIKRPAFNRTYEATFDGIPVKGFMIITCNTKKNRLYVLHFSAPTYEYDTLTPVREYIAGDVVILSK